MPHKKSKSSAKKTVVIKKCKAHRIFVLTTFSILFLLILAAMVYLIVLSEFGFEINFLLISIPIILLLPYPLYYASWQITLDAVSIQRRIFWLNQKPYPWTQVEEVRSSWFVSERNFAISIKLKGKKTIRFRMDCENAEAARKLILSHCSITEYR